MNTLVALCALGAERILGNELKLLGYTLCGNAPGRVSFSGNDDALYRANLCLRTADRVFLQMGNFPARNFDEFFDGVYTINWQDFFRKDTKVVIDKVRCHKSRLDSEHAVQASAHKAIYKKLSDRWRMSSMPESGDEADVRVYLDNDKALILLDLSGKPLHKRGYRTDGGLAPLRETVAAVLLQEMLWKRKTPLLDPFCGAGTIPIEAMLYAHNVAPGFARHFALETMPFFDPARATEIRRIEAEKIRTDIEVRITGSDVSKEAVERSRKNTEHACAIVEQTLKSIGSNEKIKKPQFVQADISTITAQYESGLILCNPPYGERLGDEELAKEVYQKMHGLWDEFSGWDFGVITTHRKFQEAFGHYAPLLKSIKSGKLDTILYIYRNSQNSKNKDK
ncbi:MAG: class I SAM-dependent RNA methyltransferase [Treponema sp.]|nr:class I SAM-dependent RNA methyltransferase [Treponema sp.]